MTFKEVIVTPYIRRRSWPAGDYAIGKHFKEHGWYWERHMDKRSNFYTTTIDVPGDDWEAFTPDFLKGDGGGDG